MPTVSTIVQSQVNAADSTASTISDKVKADGYFGNADGLHTVAYITSSDFVGTIKMQGSLATNPDNSDGARVRALELLGKSVALFTDKVETEDKTERDAESIKAELEARLNRLLG